MFKKRNKKIAWAALLVFILTTVLSTLPARFVKSADVGDTLLESAAPIIGTDNTITFSYKGEATDVYLAGSMYGGDWGATKQAMTKNANGVWTKTIDVAENDSEFTYKFIVDGSWIVDPKNPNGKDDGYGGSNSWVNLVGVTKAAAPIVDKENKTITFTYKNPEATTINLAGEMNGWSGTATSMDKNEYGVFSKTISYEDGVKGYEYKLVVDGASDWILDLSNSKTNNGNSYVQILSDAESGSGVINDDGTITFRYKEAASSVYVTGDMNGWNTKANSLTKGADGIWTTKIRLDSDNAQTVKYKLIVDGTSIQDPLNNEEVDDGFGGKNSVVNYPAYTGRTVTLPGTLSLGFTGGSGTWNVSDPALKMDYIGNGLYKKTISNFKAGRYEYKVALNNSWSENYGDKGAAGGSNISLNVPSDTDITFWYNDDSHNVVNSLSYKTLTIDLLNNGVSIGKLTDKRLNGVYKCKVSLTAGTYSNLSLSINDGTSNKTVNIDEFTLESDKDVTFTYDPITEICFNDSSDHKVDINSIYYDSRDTDFKEPYGATPISSKIDFSIKIKNDEASSVKLVVTGPIGTKVVDLEKNGSFDDENEKWSGSFTPSKIGTYSYYFAISNGNDIKAYGDDDGFFGTGKAGELGEPSNYEFNVCTSDFKTPDWLKNGVIYQIYPDRFFNGDLENDYLQKYARGNTQYEFPTNWYSLPKNPQLMSKPGYDYPSNANLGKDKDSWSNDLYGGDLKGIEAKVKYLKSLGVTILYMNPIGQSISSHRYDTTNYNTVDPLLGNLDDFVNLSKVAKANGMHIILDGVFNHISDDSIYFDKYGKYIAAGKPLGAYQYYKMVYDEMNNNGLTREEAEAKTVAYYNAKGITDFHYKDWFIINNTFDSVTGKYSYTYEGWGGYDSMPVIQALNGSEYNISSWADEIIDGDNSVARQWLRNGSSGWRLDVANEVSDETWRAFRNVVKEEGDNAIIGEIWTDASSYLLGDMYDSVMNYRFRGSMLGYVQGTKTDDNAKAPYSAKDAMNELEKMREQYPKEALEVMMNLVDSHDTQRAISSIDGYGKGGENRDFAKDPTTTALEKMHLLSLLQMTYVGSPTIYYGDEMGLPGCDDPDNRRAVPWGKGNEDLVNWYAQLASIRSSYSNLRTGDTNVSKVNSEYENDVLAYTRIDSSNKALVAGNRLGNEIEVTLTTPGIEDGTKLTNILDVSETYVVENGEVTAKIPAYRGIILVDNVKDVSYNKDGLVDAYSEEYIVSDRIAPKDDIDIISEINSATNGSTVVISTINEGISRNVLQALVDNKDKGIIPILIRGNTKLIIKDPEGLLNKLIESGQNDVQIIMKEEIENKEILDKFGNIIVGQISFSTNLPDGILGTEIEIQVPVDKEYIGKTLYLYYVTDDNKVELMSKGEVTAVLGANGEVESGLFTCYVNHFSDFIIVNEEIQIDSEGNPIASKPEKTGDTVNKFILILGLMSVSTVIIIMESKYRRKKVK
ncbi:MAG: hypothetical protein GX275_05455 [Clostridiales bacterium]|nr:hypothetical protein [Clostridiales bacterium]